MRLEFAKDHFDATTNGSFQGDLRQERCGLAVVAGLTTAGVTSDDTLRPRERDPGLNALTCDARNT